MVKCRHSMGWYCREWIGGNSDNAIIDNQRMNAGDTMERGVENKQLETKGHACDSSGIALIGR